jgi:NAD(P)-dependent dehydrogenase (short-subunit alcohol dehydrogenase family)
VVRDLRIAIVNVADDVGSRLVRFFCDKGMGVLGIDVAGNTVGMPSEARGLAIEADSDAQSLARSILRGLRNEGTIQVLVNNFGSGLANTSMAKGRVWALSTSPQVKASFAATRAFLTVMRQRRGLLINLGLGTGPVDEHCPVRYALLGFAHSLGLMDLDNVRVVNLCLHNMYGEQTGVCSRCAGEGLFIGSASESLPLEHLYVTGRREVGELVLDVLETFVNAAGIQAGSD